MIWTDLLAIVVGIVGVARLTRAIVYDDFPPFVWWRIKWAKFVDRGPWWRMWEKLFTCWWCLSTWVALACVLWWAFLNPLSPIIETAWWVFWGTLAVGYTATMLIVRDTPKE